MSVEMSVTGETRQVLREENPYSKFNVQCSVPRTHCQYVCGDVCHL